MQYYYYFTSTVYNSSFYIQLYTIIHFNYQYYKNTWGPLKSIITKCSVHKPTPFLHCSYTQWPPPPSFFNSQTKTRHVYVTFTFEYPLPACLACNENFRKLFSQRLQLWTLLNLPYSHNLKFYPFPVLPKFQSTKPWQIVIFANGKYF